MQCSDCQESLFARIQLGEFDFPEQDWARISDSAIDLIKHLLVGWLIGWFCVTDFIFLEWLRGVGLFCPRFRTMSVTSFIGFSNRIVRSFSNYFFANVSGHV